MIEYSNLPDILHDMFLIQDMASGPMEDVRIVQQLTEGPAEGPNEDALQFMKLLEDANQPCYESCKHFSKHFSKLSAIVHLYHMKCLNGWTNKSFTMLLQFLLDFFPSNAKLPKDCYEAKKIIKDLGLSYEKIHACPKDCILYWRENAIFEACPNCNISRWENNESKGQQSTNASSKKIKKKAAKILRRKFSYIGHRRFLDNDHKFRKQKNSFDGHADTRSAPITVSRGKIMLQMDAVADHVFGKKIVNLPNKRKRREEALTVWKNKSIFFTLPYLEHHVLRHNLDVMHIEKNVVDNIISTLLNLDGKTKDNLKACQDLKDIGIRSELHLEKVGNDQTHMPRACYHMNASENDGFLQVLKDVRVPMDILQTSHVVLNSKNARLVA
ncbi:uncharacterized protein LOC126701630 [Quercus robur]|uniref:uncharacterized protein LOC126701630 n=1 Tax=Quercus robur TaxID=38942 RepID=UPI0021611C58|nr:uncharacterized protein LOC126701630 [Quercus robur]